MWRACHVLPERSTIHAATAGTPHLSDERGDESCGERRLSRALPGAKEDAHCDGRGDEPDDDGVQQLHDGELGPAGSGVEEREELRQTPRLWESGGGTEAARDAKRVTWGWIFKEGSGTPLVWRKELSPGGGRER